MENVSAAKIFTGKSPSSMAQFRGKALVVVTLTSAILFAYAWFNVSLIQNDDVGKAIQNQRRIGAIQMADHQDSVPDNVGYLDPGVKKAATKRAICDNSIRIGHLNRICDDMKLTNEPIPWQELSGRHWIVDDAHRVFYCLIPKAATHTIRQLLATPILGRLNVSVLYPMQSYLSATGFRLLYHLDEDERRAVLDDYFKMIVVRHPLDRLRSAYANKMKQAGTLNWQVLHKHQHIIEEFLRRKGKLAGVDGDSFDPMNMTIEFEEFVDLIGVDDKQFVDEHWMTFYDTCFPCSIHYDAVMRVETLEGDASALYRFVGSDNGSEPTVGLNNADLSLDPASKLSAIRSVFRKIPANVMARMLRIYDKDFRMFGYHWDPDEGATCHISSDNFTGECC